MRSPILRAELHHQRSTTLKRPPRRVRRFLRTSVVIVGLLIALGLFALEGYSAVVHIDLTEIITAPLLKLLALNLLPLLLLPLVLVVHFTAMLLTLMNATHAIRREHQRDTWQLLKLTDQSAVRIVVGKWSATILNLSPLYLLLTLLRVGVIVFIGLELFRFDNFYYDRNSPDFFLDVKSLPLLVRPQMLLLGAALIALFTFANLLLTAALGILVSTLRRGGHGGGHSGGHSGDQVALGLVLRTTLFGLPALLFFLSTQRYFFGDSSFANAVLNNAIGVSLIDNGTLVASALLTAPRYQLNFVLGSSSTQFYPPTVIPVLLAIYALITVAALALAIHFARRSD